MFEEEKIPEEDNYLIGFLEIVWKRKYQTLIVLVVSMAVGVWHTFFIAPEIYAVKATLMPLKPERALPSELRMLASVAGVAGIQTGDEDINRFINILQSRTLTEQVIEDLNLIDALFQPSSQPFLGPKEPLTQQQVVKLLQERIVQVSDSGQGLVEITVELDNPELAANIANRYVDFLENLLKEKTLTVAKHKREFIEKRTKIPAEELALAEEALRNFKEKHMVVAIDIQAAELAKSIGELKGTLMMKEVQLEVLDGFGAGVENEAMSQVKTEIKALKGKIEKLEYGSSLDGSTSEGNLDLSISEFPEIEIELLRLIRNQKIQETLYTFLVAEHEKAKLDEAKEEISFIHLDHAIPTEKPVRPKKLRNLVLACMISGFLGIGFAFFREYMTTVRSEWRRRKGNAIKKQAGEADESS